MTFQPRDNIFECSTSKRASSVLSMTNYEQVQNPGGRNPYA